MKNPKTHVDLRVIEENLEELCEAQAKYRFTAFYSLDGTRTTVKSHDSKSSRPVVARSAARHDGELLGGELTEGLEAGTYAAEFAAVDGRAARGGGPRAHRTHV